MSWLTNWLRDYWFGLVITTVIGGIGCLSIRTDMTREKSCRARGGEWASTGKGNHLCLKPGTVIH